MTREESGDKTPPEDPTASKVGRIIADRDLDPIGDRLEHLWQGDDGDQYSLRELAEYFNLRVLEAAIEESELKPLEGEIENIYELLTDDDTTSGVRTRTQRHLEREGIDVEQLEADFVSHQAIHTYLTKYRGVEHNTKNKENVTDKGRERIQRLISRTEIVTENTISSLRNSGRLSVEEFDVTVTVQVTCRGCNSQYDIATLFRNGSCACDE